jgi:hypothetical protein
MSNDFDVIFETPSPCCGIHLHWEWDETVMHFHAECDCMKRYHLIPATADVERDAEEFENDDE